MCSSCATAYETSSASSKLDFDALHIGSLVVAVDGLELGPAALWTSPALRPVLVPDPGLREFQVLAVMPYLDRQLPPPFNLLPLWTTSYPDTWLAGTAKFTDFGLYENSA
jgi:hypothetical protein